MSEGISDLLTQLEAEEESGDESRIRHPREFRSLRAFQAHLATKLSGTVPVGVLPQIGRSLSADAETSPEDNSNDNASPSPLSSFSLPPPPISPLTAPDDEFFPLAPPPPPSSPPKRRRDQMSPTPPPSPQHPPNPTSSSSSSSSSSPRPCSPPHSDLDPSPESFIERYIERYENNPELQDPEESWEVPLTV